MTSKNHKALDKMDQNSKILTPHSYIKRRIRRQITWGEGECKASTEKPKPKLDTRNNLLSLQSIHRRNHYPNLELANMVKGRGTRYVSTDESCNEMRKQRGKSETKKNQQTIESSSSYEREHKSEITKNLIILKTKTSRDYRRQNNDEEDNIKND